MQEKEAIASFLLKQQSSSLPAFSFPERKQEPNETEVACAIREVEEETGCNIEEMPLKGNGGRKHQTKFRKHQTNIQFSKGDNYTK